MNGPWRWGLYAVLCLIPIWFSLGNHPIHGDSEARYGVIARAMAEGDSPWLVPMYFDRPHLTKPPLTYWLMAGPMAVLGDSEWVLRLPAATAGSLTLAVAFAFAWRRYGRDAALVSTAILSVTPMFVVLSRLATTDSILGLFCTAAFASGVLAVAERRRRWAVLLWSATALGLLTKGPAALLPVAALFMWVAWTRPARGWRALQPWFGLPAALLPLLGWAALIAIRHPEAWTVWRYETLDRAVGTGDHPEPWWFFGPVGLVGLLPGSVLLLHAAGAWLRRGRVGLLSQPTESGSPEPASASNPAMNLDHLNRDIRLWLVAIALTLLIFSLISGKLMSYLLPLAGPTAWSAIYLLYFKNYIYKFNWAYSRGAWLAAIFFVVILTLVEDHVFSLNPPAQLVAEIHRHTGLDRPQVLTIGFSDRRLPYYTRKPTDRIDPRVLDHVWENMRKDDLVLLADPERWDRYAADPYWDLSQRFIRLNFEVRLGDLDKDLRVYRTRPELR